MIFQNVLQEKFVFFSYVSEVYQVCLIREVLPASTSDIRDDMGKNLGESASGVIYDISIFEMSSKKKIVFCFLLD